MARPIRATAAVIALWALAALVAGCAGQAATLPDAAALDAQATIQVAQAQIEATRQAEAAATAQAVQATQAALAVQATAAAAATGQALATAESVAIRTTEIAVQMSVDHATSVARATSTAAAATLEAEITREYQRNQNVIMARIAEQRRLQRQAFWRDVLNFLLAVLLAAAVIAFLATAAAVIMRVQHLKDHPIQQVITPGYNTPVIVAPNGLFGSEVLRLPSGQPQRALPAPDGDEDDQPLALVSPRWQIFESWQDDQRLPIGADAAGRVITVDRNRTPHISIIGATGAGKSASGAVPIAAGLAGTGAHVVIFNAMGSDFAAFEDAPNVTLAHEIARNEKPQALAALLRSMVQEIDRRNEVLRRYAVRSWRDLPARAGEAGEVAVLIDEFMAIIEAARRLDRAQAQDMYGALIALTAEGRKFGLFVVLTTVDPTGRAGGNDWLTIRGQTAPIVFRMNNEAASRTILGGNADWPRGTVGLPTGQFVALIEGQARHGAGFYPSAEQARRYVEHRAGREVRLPETLQRALDNVTPRPQPQAAPDPAPVYAYQWQDGNGAILSYPSQAAQDAEKLHAMPADVDRTSRNKVACYLCDLESGKANAEQYARLRVALRELIRTGRGGGWAAALLAQYQSS